MTCFASSVHTSSLKNRASAILFLLAVQLLAACSRQDGRTSEQSVTLNRDGAVRKDSVFYVTCSSREENRGKGILPVLVQSCRLKKFSCIRRGIPDEKGRYSYHSEWFEDSAGKSIPVQADAIFNQRKPELLQKINEEIKAAVQQQMSDPELAACFKGFSFQPISFSELEISMSKSGLDFEIGFGFSEECLSVDGLIISMTFEELREFMRT